MSSWKLTLPCTRAEAEAINNDMPQLAGLDPMPTLVTSEEDEAADRWRLDAYFDGRPDLLVVQAITAAIPSASGGQWQVEHLDDEDWVTLSQSGFAPVRAGRFFIHTCAQAPLDAPGVINMRIEASQAFGTGHHETTSGCLVALDHLHRSGRRYRNIADIGTGTGLLAFAALALWPRARATASDIDPVSIAVTAENAAANGVLLGARPCMVALTVADGTNEPLIQRRAPYDLIIANILAGPLITLAPALAAIAMPGTALILAGLLKRQRSDVVRAYRRAGFRLDDNGGNGDWPALRLTMRDRAWRRRPIRTSGAGGLPPGDFGSW